MARAVLGCFVRALRWVQGSFFIISRVLWGLTKVVAGEFFYFIKARGLFSAKCRGVGVIMDVIDFPLCLRDFFGKLF